MLTVPVTVLMVIVLVSVAATIVTGGHIVSDTVFFLASAVLFFIIGGVDEYISAAILVLGAMVVNWLNIRKKYRINH